MVNSASGFVGRLSPRKQQKVADANVAASTLTGSQTRAGDNALLAAQGDLNVGTVTATSHTTHYAGSGPNTSARDDLNNETVSGSSLTAGRDLALTETRREIDRRQTFPTGWAQTSANLAQTGSIDAQGAIALTAWRDLTLRGNAVASQNGTIAPSWFAEAALLIAESAAPTEKTTATKRDLISAIVEFYVLKR